MPDRSSTDSNDSDPGSSRGFQFASELLSDLDKIDPDLFRGQGRFPPGAELRYGPAQVRSILAVANKALRFWDRLPSKITADIVDGLKELVRTAGQIEGLVYLPVGEFPPEAEQTSSVVDVRLDELLTFFAEVVEPLLEAKQSANTSSAQQESDNMRRTRQELDDYQGKLTELEARFASINAELEARNELVEAARAESGSAGTQDLAKAYQDQAEEHEQQWKYWGVGLAVSTLIALVAGYVALNLNHPPDEATTSELVSHVAIDILVVGILIYVIRVMSLQFSVHRHLAAVASNKAAALSTFSRIVSSGSSSDTRDRLAEVLANHVFVSGDTGFLDAAGDQITLPERLAAPVADRLAGRGSTRAA